MGLMKPRGLGAIALAVSLLLGAPLGAQETGAPETKEAPLQAGSEGVPVPKRSKTVPPQYPPEAQAAGIRGIVILELVVDPQGKVESVNVIRSVPGLDEAAVEAARQWEYEITKVGGKPVSVRLTVPITFAMRLPEVTRQEGIPELRQGAVPAFPEGERGAAEVAAEMTIDGDGMVTEIRMVQGEAPWTDAALRALRTWRFSAPSDGAPISFRVQAEFTPARGKDAHRVALRLDSVRRGEAFASTPTPASAPPPPPTTVASAPIPPPTVPSAPAATPASPTTATPAPGTVPPTTAPPAPAPVSPAPTPAAPTPPPASSPAPSPAPTASPRTTAQAPPPAQTPPAQTPPAQTPPGQAPPAGALPAPGKTAPPPVEVISAPPPPEPAETGSSAVRDVVLAESGVPDLARGRRPVVPPFARMTGTQGAVEVDFSVGASGTTNVQSVKGPDLLRPAAEQTVASWIFRRTKVERLFLVALFNYDGDKVTASVKPQEPAAATP
jgi:TonB family protein